jgi:hypothetical protein
VLALEAKQPETSSGGFPSYVSILPIVDLLLSKIVSGAALASHSRYGEESLRDTVIDPAQLLEDRQKLHGWKIQEGGHTHHLVAIL